MKIHHPSSTIHHPERGNAFLFILIGVALFAALAFMITHSLQSETTHHMSNRDLTLAASDIVGYAQKIARTVNRVRGKGCSENDISFDNDFVAGYTHAVAPPAKCEIFKSTGTYAVKWEDPPSNANDGSDWTFTGDTCIVGVGTGGAGCRTDTVDNEEILMVLPNVTVDLCDVINDKLEIGSTPTDTGTSYAGTPFKGAFTDDTEINIGSALSAACYKSGADYHFYYVLLER